MKKPSEKTPALKVLVVGNYPGDRQQSMRRYVEALVAGLRAVGVEADTLAPSVVVGYIGVLIPRIAKWAGYVDKYVLFPAKLWRRASRYDLIHIADHSNAPYQRWRRGKPLLITCHDLIAVEGLIAEPNACWPSLSFTGRLLQRWILKSLRYCPAIVCVSEATANDVRRIVGVDRVIEYIPNALNGFYCTIPTVEADSVLRDGGIDPDVPFYLHVGGNQFYKNRPGVVRLFEALASQPCQSDTRLILAGKAPDRPLINAISTSPERSSITVLVDPVDDMVRALYNRAAALLFISFREGFGWPIVEAQACGCPVVTTDAEPMRSILGNGGVLVSASDPEDAAARIIAAVNNRRSHTACGYENIARFSGATIWEKYADVYRRIVKDSQMAAFADNGVSIAV